MTQLLVETSKNQDISYTLTDEELHFKANSVDKLTISVAQIIGRRIVVNGLIPGATLPREQELCDIVGVSRTVLREAVKTLVEKGLIETRQKAGTLVSPRSNWNLFDKDVLRWLFEHGVDEDFKMSLVELRSAIEPSVVKLAARKAGDSDLKKMEKALILMEEATTPEAYLNADVTFHMSMFHACKNEFLIQFRTVIKQILKGSFQVQQTAVIESDSGKKLHRALYEKIASGDVEGAEITMKYIIQKAEEELVMGTLKK
ncbi:MAG: FadR/GntR family transcriptional regulator [Planktomarina sp.]|nr:FadR/GntR family transcriptional regulator [Planktomarina sp.]